MLPLLPLKAQTWLSTIPGPDDTGGMVMPLVYLDLERKAISVDLVQGDRVTLFPLQEYKVWGGYPYADAMFDPRWSEEPWYDLLDPTRQHLPFSTQFGFEVVSGNGNRLPEETYVYIKASSVSEGLRIYDVGYWSDVWEQEGGMGWWSQVFGEGNFGETIGLDNLAAWGDRGSIKMWHPVAVVDDFGLYSATFEIYLGDGFGTPVEGWTAADPLTLHWVAVPEPSWSVVMTGGLLVIIMAFTKRWKWRRA